MTAIRAITFDFWSTLFRDVNSGPRQQMRMDAFADAAGLSVEVVSHALRQTWAEFDRHHRQEQRTLSARDAVRLTAATLGIAFPPDAANDLATVFATAILHHAPEPVEGALEAVRAAAAFVPLGIVSDAGVSPGTALRTLLERHGFLNYFRAFSFSDEVRVSKPQRPMFETAARNLGVTSKDLLHIGDLEYSDVAGAKAFGARAALFTGDNARYREHTQADYVFSSWREFIDALPTLCDSSRKTSHGNTQ